jgi:hypothetical protein
MRRRLPDCSLKKIFGRDFRVIEASPKDVAERALKPLIDSTFGPFTKETWSEIEREAIPEEIYKYMNKASEYIA